MMQTIFLQYPKHLLQRKYNTILHYLIVCFIGIKTYIYNSFILELSPSITKETLTPLFMI
jgi:hypothetical protein